MDHLKGNSTTGVEADERRKMVEMARKSNFNIGGRQNDLYAQDTSSGIAFAPRLSPKTSHANVPKQDYKAAHFKFGNQNTRYVTTNGDNYNDQIMRDCMGQMAEQKRGKNFQKEK